MDNGFINNNYITCEIRLHRLDVGNRSLFGYFNPQINCVPSGKRFVIFPIPTPPPKKNEWKRRSLFYFVAGPDWKWISYLLLSVSLPVIQHSSMQIGCLSLFIPIMGRSGTSLNSEIVIALFSNITFGMLVAYIVRTFFPFVFLADRTQ